MEKAKLIRCRKCGRHIRDTFANKWRHIAKRHPDVMADRLLPLLFKSPEELQQIGRMAGEWLRNRLV
jgi:hypothetical protein